MSADQLSSTFAALADPTRRAILARLAFNAPIAAFSAPTTINDTVPRYLKSGRIEPRPSVPTIANAMDVGNPSNLERLQWLFGGAVCAMRCWRSGDDGAWSSTPRTTSTPSSSSISCNALATATAQKSFSARNRRSATLSA
jgi:threonine synthase